MTTLAQHVAIATVSYMEEDLRSFEAVVSTTGLRGKLGVAMITNATAALDLFAWILYQKFDVSVKNGDLFKKIISDHRFFPQGAFINEKVLYGLVRCGVVHQFYPKGLKIIAIDNSEVFIRRGDTPCINCLGFYRAVLIGLTKARDYIISLSGEEMAGLDFKMELRQRMDEEALEGSKLDVESLKEY